MGQPSEGMPLQKEKRPLRSETTVLLFDNRVLADKTVLSDNTLLSDKTILSVNTILFDKSIVL
jgi:hypothetical protein